MCTSATSACCRSTMRLATCSARSSTRNASSSTTPSIASSKSSGKRDMCTPFCEGSRSTVQSIVAAISFSRAPRPMRTAFWTPVTPARDRPSATSGVEACRSSSSWREGSATPVLCRTPVENDTYFAKLVSLGCHDVRTPLATVHGFAKTLERVTELEPPADRYVEMIELASAQMAELLDELSLAARIESGRYEPALREADTLALAEAARERLGEDVVQVDGDGTTVSTDVDAVERGVSALVQSVLRHGGLDEVAVLVRGNEIDVSPVTPASAPVVLGQELRDLGAAVAVRAIETLGGAVTVDGGTLTIRLA